jgi:hypothetical protein
VPGDLRGGFALERTDLRNFLYNQRMPNYRRCIGLIGTGAGFLNIGWVEGGFIRAVSDNTPPETQLDTVYWSGDSQV